MPPALHIGKAQGADRAGDTPDGRSKKWIKSCTTMEEQLDFVVKEQFLDTLQPDTCIWVKERKPMTGEKAGRPRAKKG